MTILDTPDPRKERRERAIKAMLLRLERSRVGNFKKALDAERQRGVDVVNLNASMIGILVMMMLAAIRMQKPEQRINVARFLVEGVAARIYEELMKDEAMAEAQAIIMAEQAQ